MAEYRGVLAGLGNPGQEYAGTRHNCGFAFLETLFHLAEKSGRVERLNGNKFCCDLRRVILPQLEGQWLCVRPLTFMNSSGDCLQPLLAWHKLEVAKMVVIHDELDLPVGDLRFKFGGGNAGHNGLKSITARFGSPDFYRLRIGIGRPLHKTEILNWVLGRPNNEDSAKLEQAREAALSVLFTFVAQGCEAASLEARRFKPI